jgi:hypothetical protein
MSEPIPDHSHIFGGTWYQNRVGLWGEPSPQAIAMALQHQREARQYIPVASKANIASISQDMARKKVNEATVVSEATIVSTEAATIVSADAVAVASVEPVKKPRKPRVVRKDATVEILPVVERVAQAEQVAQAAQVAQVAQVEQVEQAAQVKKARKKAAKAPTVENAPVQETRICKEVVIPTHIEQQLEEIDANDYEIEYVPLSFIDIEHTTYFRDAKNKLYQKIKEKIIGPYIGRYCPHTESICTEIPDSDEENDS